MAHAKMLFPSDFRWGTATSSYQVEGNNHNSDWWAWEQKDGTVLEGHQTGKACNWWENAEIDLDLAAEMGTNAHRLSIEWSRIEPEPSVFDRTAIDRYRQILQSMVDRGIEPMVTLHHFSNPLWLSEKGDFNSGVIVDYFQRYTARVVNALGDLVPTWVTINEPMVYIFARYLAGDFPAPQKGGWGGALEAAANMLRCHAIAYHTIKEINPTAQVGVAKNFLILEAWPNSGRLNQWWARRMSWLFNDLWLSSLVDGRLHLPIGRSRIKHLAGSLDFLGVNYYTRFYVQFPPGENFIERTWKPGAVISDGDYGEIYPAGFFQVLKHALRYQKPIYITENGVPDKVDRLRPSFLITHLREVWRAITFCYPIMGYYHWSLIDNFEWDRGWTQRFGLIALDVETQNRTWRDSGRLYQEICQKGYISSNMAARYAPELLDELFPGQSPVTMV